MKRRESDNAPNDYSSVRPASIAPWVTVDARVAYRFAQWVQLGLRATNLFNAQGQLIKVGNYPFDYRIPGRRLLGPIELDF